ncbi:serine O-acetyltransferase [Kineococcus arenarius]|uniref:serine O-acetyltransferase n=1 Tax=unclassified Kineococcus TaxID=2621656 RepID=UPI003D7C7D05
MKDGSALRAALEEARRCHGDSWFAPGFAAVAVHHFASWAEAQSGPVRPVLRRAARAGYLFVRNIYSIDLPTTVKIGRRFRIAHAGGVIIHPDAVFGDDCVLRQNVTIGAAGNGDFHSNHPTLGDRVDIGAGAVVMGRITVGDDVTIGPNAVVMNDVAAGTMVISPQPRRMLRPGARPAAAQQDPAGD